MNTEPITAIFGTTPTLTDIRLVSCMLHQDGPTLTLLLDLSEFPEDPPQKWTARNCNVVQVEISLSLLESGGIRIEGWGLDNLGILDISEAPGGFVAHFRSESTTIRANASHASVSKVSAYWDSSKPPRIAPGQQ